MNLHDFVAEPVNPEHSFHDAHTVPFCLTADHIATCHMFLCPHQVSTVLVCLWTRVVWKTFGTSDDGIWSHSWSPTRRVETWQPPWSPMERCGGNVAASMESHGQLSSGCGVWWSDTTAGNGCSGMHRLTVSRQLATDAVVCTVSQCLDSWCQHLCAHIGSVGFVYLLHLSCVPPS